MGPALHYTPFSTHTTVPCVDDGTDRLVGCCATGAQLAFSVVQTQMECSLQDVMRALDIKHGAKTDETTSTVCACANVGY